MFGPTLEPPPDPPPAEVTTFEQQYPPPADPADGTGGATERARGPGADRLSVDLSVRFTSDYTFRGIAQRNDRLSMQTGVEVACAVAEGERWSLGAFAGLWADTRLDDLGDSPGGFDERFYELDLYAGVAVGVGRVGASVTFTEYTSPTGDFARIHEVALGLTYDDSGVWGERGAWFSLGPSATIAFEMGPDGADGGAHAGVFLALGVAPTIDLGPTPLGALTLSAPLEIGLSVSDYYEAPGGDETYGYASVGAALSLEPGGAWPTITFGADYTDFGPGPEALASRGGEQSVWVELAWSF